MKTTPKSIIVIEDIDCSINLTNRNWRKGAPPSQFTFPVDPSSELGAMAGPPDDTTKSITLSGLLNFTDGLWSCCGSERIFVFTTNHVEKLDPALVRSGRMDMHIFMSHCSFPALKILLRNYLEYHLEGEGNAEEGRLLRELEEAVGSAQMTPADVSEVLIKNRRKEKGRAMAELLEVLRGQAEKRKARGGGQSNEEVEEEEEQEKRALESPPNKVEEGSDAGEDCNAEEAKD